LATWNDVFLADDKNYASFRTSVIWAGAVLAPLAAGAVLALAAGAVLAPLAAGAVVALLNAAHFYEKLNPLVGVQSMLCADV